MSRIEGVGFCRRDTFRTAQGAWTAFFSSSSSVGGFSKEDRRNNEDFLISQSCLRLLPTLRDDAQKLMGGHDFRVYLEISATSTGSATFEDRLALRRCWERASEQVCIRIARGSSCRASRGNWLAATNRERHLGCNRRLSQATSGIALGQLACLPLTIQLPYHRR